MHVLSEIVRIPRSLPYVADLEKRNRTPHRATCRYMLVTAVAIAACSLDALALPEKRAGPSCAAALLSLDLGWRASNSLAATGRAAATAMGRALSTKEAGPRVPAPSHRGTSFLHVSSGETLRLMWAYSLISQHFTNVKVSPDLQALAAPRYLACTGDRCERCLRGLALKFDVPV